MQILSKEEAIWKQRSREKWVAEGDLNTSFFHRIVSGKKRKSFIKELCVEGVSLSSEQALARGATHFFKKLFAERPDRLCDCDWAKLGFSSSWDKLSLIKLVTLEELRRAVFACKRDGAPGPDGFPNPFF